MKIVRAIRQGRIVPNRPKAVDDKPQFFNLWSTPAPDHPTPLPAPKPRLPTNAESYNPPEEYLPTLQEKDEWQDTDKEDRERDYLPQKYSALRLVPAYSDFINERFNRLLDLYLAPRIQRTKLNIDPESLIPSLPSPQSLRPFPTYLAIRERRHEARVRCLSTSPGGDWVVSGDESGLVSLWESATGHEAARWNLNGKVSAVAWCPRKEVSYFIVCTYVSSVLIGSDGSILTHVLIIFIRTARNNSMPFYRLCCRRRSTWPRESCSTQLRRPPDLCRRPLPAQSSGRSPRRSRAAPPTSWARFSSPRGRVRSRKSRSTERAIISRPSVRAGVLRCPFWKMADSLLKFFAASGTGQASVWIHQTSKRHSQAPFKHVKGAVQRVAFHPLKPHFFVAVIPFYLNPILCSPLETAGDENSD